MERLVRTDAAVSWRAGTNFRRSVLLLSAIGLVALLAYAATSRREALASILPPGRYPVRVAMSDNPDIVRTGLVQRRDIPVPAVPSELAVAEVEPVEAAAQVEPVETAADPSLQGVADPATDLATGGTQSRSSAARADFLSSFSDLSGDAQARPARASTAPHSPARPANAKDSNVLDITYDLLAGPGSAGAVEISKPLRRGDASLGALRMQVDRNAGLYASRADLARMLPSMAAQLGRMDSEYLALSRLREAGVKLRYDAARDELVLQD